MKICICGGGSLGHVCAGVFASDPQNSVRILSGHPDSWGDMIEVNDLDGRVYQGPIEIVSSEASKCLEGCDIVLLCLPGYMIKKTIIQIKDYVKEAAVGSIVSSTGFFFEAHEILDKGTQLFGFQRTPFIARVSEYGKNARLLGYKSSVSIATENITDKEDFRRQIEKLFITPTVLLDNYYQAALTNSNPILHTGRLYSLFQGKEDSIFDHNILFYKEWTDESSEILIEMDKEFFKLLDVLGVKGLPTLLDYYESHDSASLTRKISGISAFQEITSPMTKTTEGWKVDFGSRYFTEDFPYGLKYIKDLCDKHGVESPTINRIYEWGISHI